MIRDYARVPVTAVIRETADASSLVLDAGFSYAPGQFITVRVPSELTGSVARCYSLCSSPFAGEQPAITVKRTSGGYASNWILDNVVPGSVLEVLAPAGTFTPASLDGDFLLFAAGSGITPVMSILVSVLLAGRGRVVLVYANRDERSVIFAPALRELAARADLGGRLVVLHWLDSLSGLPTVAGLAALARPYAPWQPFVCGPDPFLAAVRAALGSLGVPAKRVRFERFLSLAENPFEEGAAAGAGTAGAGTAGTGTAGGGVAATLTVELDGSTVVLPWPAGMRMLDVLTDAGLDAPFSCRQGICGACACQLISGEVEMAHNEVLEEEDLADGYVLACQSTALTPEVGIAY